MKLRKLFLVNFQIREKISYILLRDVILFLSSMLLVNTCNANPSVVFADEAQPLDIRNTELANESTDLNGVQLNDSTIVYLASLNNTQGVYSFNIETEETRLLLSFAAIPTPPDFATITGPTWAGRQHVVGGGVALLSAGGAVFATDGTRAGTQFVTDFGFYTCCGNIRSTFSRVLDIQYINGAFYLNIGDFQQGLFETWISDGTTAGTTILNDSELNTRISPLTVASIDNSDRLIFSNTRFVNEIPTSRLFELNSDGSTTLLHEFRSGREVSLDSFSTAKNRSGTYFCSDFLIGISELENRIGTLWRISNDGTVTQLSQDCVETGLNAYSGEIYYSSSQGLQRIDEIGRFNASPFQISGGGCTTLDSLYYPLSNGGGLVKFNGLSSEVIELNEIGNEQISLQACTKSKILIQTSSSDFDLYVYDIETQQTLNVRGGLGSLPSLVFSGDRGFYENSQGDIFSFGKFFSDESGREVPSVLFKIGLNEFPVISPLLFLLLDE